MKTNISAKMVLGIFALAIVGFLYLFLTGCGDGGRSYSYMKPCAQTPIDLIEGFGEYDYAVYLDCAGQEIEVWLGEDNEIALRGGFADFCGCVEAWAFGQVVGPRTFEITYIQGGHVYASDDCLFGEICNLGIPYEDIDWYVGHEFEGFAFVTLCDDRMTITDIEFMDVSDGTYEYFYLLCDVFTFWELR